jgi:hypothetical protein
LLITASVVTCTAAGFGQASTGQPSTLGIFEGQSDVGAVNHPGTASFDARSGDYAIAGAGHDLWGTKDGFHFLWKKVSGDLSLTADIRVGEPGPNSVPHRKAFVMFRQSLDLDSIYADAVVHGSGETSLQYRRTKGNTTQDLQLDLGAAKTMRIEKREDTITVFASMKGEPLHQVGGSIKLHFAEPFYAGLGISSHNNIDLERATISHVELKSLAPPESPAPKAVYSTLQTIAIPDNGRFGAVVLTGKGQIEAPNWSRDGKWLIFDQDGKMWKAPVAGGEPTAIDLGTASGCTASHGLSPDGKWLAITCATPDLPGQRVYIVPSDGGEPRMATANPNSYFHSWSPDGKTIAFARPANGSINILSIPVEGGKETALTTGGGISDDPDYSPDGQYIYFNSDRAGGMQIFRMRTDGTHPEQITFDGKRNRTPHPSPDGKSVLILTESSDVAGDPANKDVTLRILDVPTGKMRDLVEVGGGGAVDNVPNWAPDGVRFAFVSYQMLPEEDKGSME